MLRDFTSMEQYISEIGNHALLSKTDEIELAALRAAGSLEARKKLIKSNLRLVVKIAHDYKGMGVPLQDLVQEGNIGLMRAAEKFDPYKGSRFSSYSSFWIKQKMRRALAVDRTVRVSQNLNHDVARLKKIIDEYVREVGVEPADEEIIELFVDKHNIKITRNKLKNMQRADITTYSIHTPIQDGEESTVEDLLAGTHATSSEIVEENDLIKKVRYIVYEQEGVLSKRERDILIARYGLNGRNAQTLEQVSRAIGRTRERVRQIQNFALKKVRREIEKNPDLLEDRVIEDTSDVSDDSLGNVQEVLDGSDLAEALVERVMRKSPTDEEVGNITRLLGRMPKPLYQFLRYTQAGYNPQDAAVFSHLSTQQPSYELKRGYKCIEDQLSGKHITFAKNGRKRVNGR